MTGRKFVYVAAFAALSVLASLPQFAGTRSLSWSPSAGATGYRVHYGTFSGDYATTLDVGNTTQHTIEEDLDDCTEWYFAVTAYNTAGESGYSPEAWWLTPLTVDSATAGGAGAPIMQGVQIPMSIDGAGFAAGAEIQVDHPNWTCDGDASPEACDVFLASLRSTVRLENPSVTCNKIQVLATIEPVIEGTLPAMIGGYTLTVVNPDNESSQPLDQAFQILKNPARFDINRSDPATVDRVDGKDLVWLSRLFWTCFAPGTGALPCSDDGPEDPGSGSFYSDYDFDGNGWIDGDDLADIAASFGSCWDGGAWKTSACD